MSKIIIVDKNDNIIGYKERGTLDHPNDIYRVSALWLENSRGEVLIAQRAYSKKDQGGKWGPAVVGTVDEGETYEDNIVKETLEEIGFRLELKDLKLGPKTFQETDRSYFRQRFIIIVDKNISEFRLQEEEVEAIQWIKKRDLIKWQKEKPEDFTKNAGAYIKMFCLGKGDL